ncbi:hypothetical protein ACHFJ0_04995 [Paracoccus sp. NGMCC 1.201697]|uniref:Collagen-like protein n=1 Tax=Paracoccus broussonetiae subsp. drimophilus TaxID=3373869 RepID=A0ABW7LHI8_9RHOB
MIDAQAFGAELAGIVKAATAPILSRLEALEKRLDAMPDPVNGKDADPEHVAGIVMGQMKVELDALRNAVDAIQIPELPDLPDFTALIDAAVKEIPAPKDGEPGPRGETGPAGRDGLDVKDLFRADGGHLIAVMSDGTTKDLGQYVGKDGTDGRDGNPGRDGTDGTDGKSFEEFTVIVDGERPVLRFQRDGVTKDVPIPGIVYRGVWGDGGHVAGDAVSFGGNVWIAKRATAEKPAEGGDWQLAVRKGRDGKDGEMKAPKPNGPVGLRGR